MKSKVRVLELRICKHGLNERCCVYCLGLSRDSREQRAVYDCERIMTTLHTGPGYIKRGVWSR